jgi:hypothetical protein
LRFEVKQQKNLAMAEHSEGIWCGKNDKTAKLSMMAFANRFTS